MPPFRWTLEVLLALSTLGSVLYSVNKEFLITLGVCSFVAVCISQAKHFERYWGEK